MMPPVEPTAAEREFATVLAEVATSAKYVGLDDLIAHALANHRSRFDGELSRLRGELAALESAYAARCDELTEARDALASAIGRHDLAGLVKCDPEEG